MLRHLLLALTVPVLAQLSHAAGAWPAPGNPEQDIAPARVLDSFVQSSPATGAAPTRRTELHIAHDARTLHITVRAFDPEPSQIIARQMRRDVEAMLSEDQVTLVIDAEGAGRNGYLFAVNAHGAQLDALVFDGGQIRYDWDAQWESEARIEPDGWSARLFIPLSVFGQHAAPVWRINAERWMPRGSERVRLAGAQPDKDVFSLGDAVTLPAIRADREGWGLRIKPSLRLTGESSSASGTERTGRRLQPGLELFHESDTGLRTAAALNIDFGEAEADERTINLTRFELFRPEKREFFLRDAGRFSFGGLSESAVIPYYSRRVGLDNGGRARSLDAGLKLTGTVAGFDFGAFAARVAGGATTPGEPDQRAADVAVLRVARPLGERQRVGLIATRGNPQGTAGSQLTGLDYQFRDTAWADNKTLEAHVWAMRSANVDADSRRSVTGQAWGGSVSYMNVGPMAEAHWQRIGDGFNPALGYLAESNVISSDGTVGWWHRTADGGSLIPAIDWDYRRKLDGSEASSELTPELAYNNAAGDFVIAKLVHERDRLASGYAPVPGAWIAPDAYRWTYLRALLETSPSRSVWASAELRGGGYYDGRRNDQMVTVGWKPTAHWGVRVGAGRNAITLPDGHFSVKLATLRLDHTPNTRMSQSLLLQWDNLSGELGVSARVRWMWAAGRELIFAVDRTGYTGERRGELPGQTRATLKMVWNLER